MICSNCGVKGHFTDMCRNPPKDKPQHQGQGQKQRGRGSYKRNSGRLHFVNETPEEQGQSSDSDEYAFAVTPTLNEVTILIEDEPINVIVDSGASVNILNSKSAAKLVHRGVEFEECRRTLHPYGSAPITAKRRVWSEVQLAGKDPVKAEFLVIPGSQPPLLGKQTSEELGILQISVNQIGNNQILAQYPDLDKGIGMLKNCEVEIHIDKDVPPVARKHSRVPFHLRKQVEN